MNSSDRALMWATWLLRLIGCSICLSLLPIFMPFSWMASIHENLGLGVLPDQPITSYLTRSVSAMYFAHGCIVLAISTDVRRFLPLVILIGLLNIFLGAVLVVIDSWAALPNWWLLLEGPPIMFAGGLLLFLASRI